MIKLEALEDFTLKRFDEIETMYRKNKEEKGKVFYGDTFICEKELAEYLTNTGKEKNPINRAVAKVIEVIPEITETPNAVEVKIELKEKSVKKTTTKRKTTKK